MSGRQSWIRGCVGLVAQSDKRPVGVNSCTATCHECPFVDGSGNFSHLERASRPFFRRALQHESSMVLSHTVELLIYATTAIRTGEYIPAVAYVGVWKALSVAVLGVITLVCCPRNTLSLMRILVIWHVIRSYLALLICLTSCGYILINVDAVCQVDGLVLFGVLPLDDITLVHRSSRTDSAYSVG